MNSHWHFYVLPVVLIVAGIMHFIKPKVYIRIMPPYLPNHKVLVYLSGIAEIVLGLALCVPALQTLAVYGIIAMLAVFLLVHFHMLSDEKASGGLPKWLLILRIPLQFGLMYWAWWYM